MRSIERCTCGDTECGSCGTAQGTYLGADQTVEVELQEDSLPEDTSELGKPRGCVAISMDRYQEACESYEGWCDVCGDFTRGSTEPDAENYDCEQCGGLTVCGAEQALLLGKIDIGPADD